MSVTENLLLNAVFTATFRGKGRAVVGRWNTTSLKSRGLGNGDDARPSSNGRPPDFVDGEPGSGLGE